MQQTIFIADDDAFLRQVYTKELSDAGYRVVAAENGEVAIKLLKKEKPAVIFLDILMPGQDGFDVLEAVKKTPALSSVPVIILTNLHQKVEVERAKELGAHEFLSKAEIKMGDLARVAKQFAKG